MAKQLSGVLKMFIAAGKAAPSPPLGPALGQVMEFMIWIYPQNYMVLSRDPRMLSLLEDFALISLG